MIHVLLPYLKLKMERLYQKWIIRAENEPTSRTLYRVVQLFVPTLNLVYAISNLGFCLLYVSGKAKLVCRTNHFKNGF